MIIDITTTEERFLNKLANGFVSFRYHQKQLGYSSPGSIQKIVSNLLDKGILVRDYAACPTCHHAKTTYIINQKKYADLKRTA